MTKNEEKNIRAALESVSDFSEIFVVDSGSTDATRDIAMQFGAGVLDFAWNGKYPKKKQWSLENAPFSNDWVLFLDADERVTPRLADEIRATLPETKGVRGYFIGLDYVFLGRTLCHGHRVQKLALVDRRHTYFAECNDLDVANMWEVEGHYQPIVEGEVASLEGRIEHCDHDDLFHYFERHNRYSDWEATRRTNGTRGNNGGEASARPRAKQVFDRIPFRSAAFFAHSYFAKRGFLDGRAGYHYALAKAFYYWQIRVKELELAQREGR